MEPINVVIKEIPEQGWLIDFLPLFIAFVALCVSIYSAKLMRKEQVRSSRPFVWAMNFASLNDNNQVTNHPETIMYKILNSPALLISINIDIYGIDKDTNKTSLHKHSSSNSTKYPDENAQYTYKIPEFNKILNKSAEYTELVRAINIEYRALAGGTTYKFESQSTFDSNEKVWRETLESAT